MKKKILNFLWDIQQNWLKVAGYAYGFLAIFLSHGQWCRGSTNLFVYQAIESSLVLAGYPTA